MSTPASEHPDVPEFIKASGACLISRNILERKGLVKWATREESANRVDNGWRILGHTDTNEFLADPNSMVVVDYNTACTIEPALIGIYPLPVGSDLQLVVDENRKRTWYDNTTGQPLTDL